MAYNIGVTLSDFLKSIKDMYLKKSNEKVNGEEKIEKLESEEDTSKEKEEALKSKIEDLKKEYENRKVDSYGEHTIPVYNNKQFKSMSEEEINDYAKQLLEGKNKIEIDNLKKINDTKKKQVEDSIQQDVKLATNEKDELNKMYGLAKDNAENQALKRGIARSSIISEQLKNFDNGLIDDIKKVDSKLYENIEKNNQKISDLEIELQENLSNLSKEQEKEIQNKIKELKDEQVKYANEVASYNNTLNEKRSKDKNELNEKTDGIYYNSDSQEYKDMGYGIADAVLEFYKDLPADEALKLFENDKKTYLDGFSQRYINYVESKLKDRAYKESK